MYGGPNGEYVQTVHTETVSENVRVGQGWGNTRSIFAFTPLTGRTILVHAAKTDDKPSFFDGIGVTFRDCKGITPLNNAWDGARSTVVIGEGPYQFKQRLSASANELLKAFQVAGFPEPPVILQKPAPPGLKEILYRIGLQF